MLKPADFGLMRAYCTVLLEDLEAGQVAESDKNDARISKYNTVFALSCHREIVPEVILYYAVYCKQ